MAGSGTKEDPWILKTPSGGAEFSAYRDASLDPPALVVQAGTTQLRYHLRAIEDLHAMLKAHGDWMLLGNADEQKPAAEGSVELTSSELHGPIVGYRRARAGNLRIVFRVEREQLLVVVTTIGPRGDVYKS